MYKKKVLELITLSEFGGAQKHIQLLMKYGNKNIHFALAYGGGGEAFKKISVEQYPCQNMVRQINPIKDYLAYREIKKIIKLFQPDVIHCHSSKAGILGRLAGRMAGVKNIVYTVHGFVFKEPGNLFKKYFYYFLEYIFGKYFTNKIICVSKEDFTIAKIINKNSFYIPNGLDFTEYKPKKRKNKDFKGMCIANFYKNKGHKYLVAALKDIKDINIDFIGEGGSEKKYIKKMVKKYDLEKQISFKGFQDINSKLLQKYDFLILPSLKEGFPYVVLEALACGLPVIASAVGGIPDLAKNTKGIIITPPGDIKELKKSIIKLINEYSELRINRIAMIKNYEIKKITQLICKVF